MRHFFNIGKDNMMYDTQANNIYMLDGVIHSNDIGFDDISLDVNTLLVNKPRTLNMIVTMNCNLACSYCFARSQHELLDISSDQAIKIVDMFFSDLELDEVNKTCPVYIRFIGGGEPLLKFKKIKEIIAYIDKNYSSKYVVKYRITTNGTILSDEIVRFLNDYDISMKISLDGDKIHHDTNRKFKSGEGTFDTIVSNVNKLQPVLANRVLAVGCVINRNSYNFHELFETFKDIGFNYIRFQYIISKDLNFSPEFQEPFYESYESFHSEYLSHLLTTETPVLVDNVLLHLIDIHKSFNGNCICNAGTSCIAVHPTGKIFPCVAFSGQEEFQIGHIDSGIDSAKHSTVVSKFKTTKEVCKKCWARIICHGGCNYANYVYSGTVREPPQEFCTYIKRSRELVMWLHAKLITEGRNEYRKLLTREWF